MSPGAAQRLITRRRLLASGLGAAAVVAFGCDSRSEPASPASPAERPPSPRPNLVLFMTDDQSWDEIGYESHGRVATPNLDRMASEGTVFRSAYCAAIPCIPSRASLMSGLNFHRWSRDRDPTGALEEGAWTWAHALGAAGYETALIGKMHLTPRRGNHGFERMALCDPKTRGRERRSHPAPLDDYERWLEQRGTLPKLRRIDEDWSFLGTHSWPFDPREHRISWVRDCAVQYLESRSPDRPFALVVSFLAPHLPYDPVEPFASMYSPDAIELPTSRWTDLSDLPPSLARAEHQGWRSDRFGRVAVQRMIAGYRALVSQVDDAIGAVARRLDQRDTLVLFASDHGDYLGKRGRLIKSPPVPFEPLARVPMLAWGAGVPRAASVERPVSLVDVAPTWLTAAGLDVPPDLDGEPLQESFTERDRDAARVVYSIGPGYFHMVRRGTVKYLRSEDGTEELLLDLATDPGEIRNVARDGAWQESRAELSAALDGILMRPPPRLPTFAAPRGARRRAIARGGAS